jgi:enolase
MMNIINGGEHADNSVDFQEFMILPVGAPSLREAVRYGAEVFHALKKVLHGRGLATAVGDEGGFAPGPAVQRGRHRGHPRGHREGRATRPAGHLPRHGRGRSEFYKDGIYDLKGEGKLDAAGMTDLLLDWVGKYPIISIEDGLAEGDWDGWKLTTPSASAQGPAGRRRSVRHQHQDPPEGIDKGIANSILIKVNQIGSLTETLEAIQHGPGCRLHAVVSHRSGETEDTTIADLVVAAATGQIKTGSLSRSDRVAKYNQLMRIEDQLGDAAVYAGRGAFKPAAWKSCISCASRSPTIEARSPR